MSEIGSQRRQAIAEPSPCPACIRAGSPDNHTGLSVRLRLACYLSQSRANVHQVFHYTRGLEGRLPKGAAIRSRFPIAGRCACSGVHLLAIELGGLVLVALMEICRRRPEHKGVRDLSGREGKGWTTRFDSLRDG